MKKDLTFGVIVGNRGFFPDHLAKEGREEMLAVLQKAGIKAITLTPEQSKFGSVETHDDAIRCGDLFRAHRDEIDGIIVTLPNFGDERGIADSIRYSKLDVPVLVQATPDRRDDMKISDRRDSFCGKMSACNNLMQYGIPYSITAQAHGAAQLRRVREGSGLVHEGLPRDQRPQEAAHRRHRRAAAGLQHRPLQREAAGTVRHLGRHAGPLGHLRRSRVA